MANPFVLDASEYKRNINPVGQYIDQSSHYLSLMTGKSYDECKEYVQRVLKNKEFPTITDPKVTYLQRQDNGDREIIETTLNEYITESLANNDLIAPTLTTYVNPKVKESLLVTYVEDNIKARGVAKRAEFAAKAAGKKELSKIRNIEQTNKKLSNNALSGAHVSASTPLYNKSAHSTLTSTCRTTTGYGNSNNEKFLNGNRHYWSSQIVINNIISIITHTDYKRLNEVISKYSLKIPSTEDVMTCIMHSVRLYWTEIKEVNKIKDLVGKLNGEQRAAFVYTGDLYHLMIHNQAFIKGFIKELSTRVTGDCPDALNAIKSLSEDYLILAHQVCLNEMKGKGKDYKAMEGTQELQTLVLTGFNITNVLNKYSDLIKAFWVTDNMPASVAYFPESIRKAALTSDTDSTIFTVQDWVIWYSDGLRFDDESMAVAATMIFLASQTITHVLAKMSANFGFENKRLFQIAMKSEFKFDCFAPANVAKTYYCSLSAQEGNIFPKREMEIKGVHLKSSNAPIRITKKASQLMEFITNSVIEGNKISILEILKDIGDIERDMTKSILRGDTEYFRLAQIKPPDSYSKGERDSPYLHYLFWEEIFSEKYGKLQPPPYQCIKIPTILENNTATKKWLDEMVDKNLATKARTWFTVNNRTVIPTIYLSLDISKGKGIPLEMQSIVNVRRIILDLCNIFYIILETLGIYLKPDTLVSDTY